LTEPGAKHFLVTVCVNSSDHNVCISDLPRVNVKDRNTLLPEVPFLVVNSNLVVDESGCCADHWTLDVGVFADRVREVGPRG